MINEQEPPFDLQSLINSDTCFNFYTAYLDTLLNCDQTCFNYMLRLVNEFNKLFWNATDMDGSLSTKLLQNGIHHRLLRLFTRDEFTTLASCRESKLYRHTIHSVIGILHNILLHCPLSRPMLASPQLIDRLVDLSGCGGTDHQVDTSAATVKSKHFLSLQTASCLLLVVLIDDESCNCSSGRNLFTNKAIVTNLVDALRSAISTGQLPFLSRHHGFSAVEINQGLIRLACADNVKRLLIEQGVVQLIERLMTLLVEQRALFLTEPSDRLQLTLLFKAAESTLELLLTLFFVDEFRTSIRDMHNLLKLIDAFNNTDWSRECRLRCSALNFSLASADTVRRPTSRSAKKVARELPGGHVMLSYQHSCQDVMIRVRDGLISRGYRVWMDIDNMYGSLVERMDEAVQQAAAIVAATCQAFELSAYCRLEMEHASQIGVPTFALQLEPNFKPYLWLARVLSSNTHQPPIVVSDDMLDESLDQLTRLLDKRGSNHVMLNSSSISSSVAGVSVMNNNNESTSNPLSSLFPVSDIATMRQMYPFNEPDTATDQSLTSSNTEPTSVDPTKDQSSSLLLLVEYGLIDANSPPEDRTALLTELNRLRLKAPGSLSASLRLQQGLGLTDQLKFFASLARLFDVSPMGGDDGVAVDIPGPAGDSPSVESSSSWLTTLVDLPQLLPDSALSFLNQLDQWQARELLRLRKEAPALLSTSLRRELNLNLEQFLHLSVVLTRLAKLTSAC